ncbi:hypothetical protein TB1_014207 [Malus domestica]
MANTKPRSLNSLDNVSKAGHPVLSCCSRWIQYAFAAANLQVSLDGLLKQLRVLKSVMVDWWWGIVEGYGGYEYNWNGYKRLF